MLALVPKDRGELAPKVTSARLSAVGPRPATDLAPPSGAPMARASGYFSERLQLGSPQDQHEHAADRVATELAAPTACPTCASGREEPCPTCGTASSSVLRPSLGGGAMLPDHLRRRFETRLGADLSRVRVHEGPQAQAKVRALNANAAFALGSDIVLGARAPAPYTPAGERLLAHEVAHTLQPGADRIVRRDGPAAASPDGSKTIEPPAEPQGELLMTFRGVEIYDDVSYMLDQMKRKAAAEGLEVPFNFYLAVKEEAEGNARFNRIFGEDPADMSGAPHPQETLEREGRAASVMHDVAMDVQQEAFHFPRDFARRASEIAVTTLDRSEREEEAEAFRYGITWRTFSEPIADCMFGDCTYERTEYSMGASSAAFAGLKAGAQILLTKRHDLDRSRDEMEAAEARAISEAYETGEGAGAGQPLEERVPAYGEAVRAHQKKRDTYELVRGHLGRSYPILNAFGDLEADPDGLEALTKGTAGPQMASLLGNAILERLKNIRKVRAHLADPEEVNVWRLDNLVKMTMAEMQVDAFEKRMVDDEVEAAKPGLLETVALLVLNVGALLLAAPTGGVSLGVAAGVNAAVAYGHIKDYQMQMALSGTAFDRAQALSSEKPSFVWLAVELIGVALDVGAAFKAITATIETLRAAKASADAAEVAAQTAKLKQVAAKEGGEELARKVLAHIDRGPSEAELLKALKLTDDEIGALATAGRVGEEQLGIAAAAAAHATGQSAKISPLGHIFSCSSPCIWMREKYAALLGPEMVQGKVNALRARYLDFEKRAAQAAEAVKTASPKDLAKAEMAVDALEKEIAAFDKLLAVESRIPRIGPALARLGQQYKILQDLPLDAAAIQRVLAKAGNLDHMKGQLLEELMAVRVRGMMADEALRGVLGVKPGVGVEFVEGYRITDLAGGQLTDGMILVSMGGNKYRVVTILESKAGLGSSRGLRYAYQSAETLAPDALAKLEKEAIELLMKEDRALAGLSAEAVATKFPRKVKAKVAKLHSAEKLARGELGEMEKYAIDLLRKEDRSLAGLSAEEVAKQFPGKVEARIARISKGEAGQFRKSLERTSPFENEDYVRIKVDGVEREVAAGPQRTRLIGALPEDVSADRLAAALKTQGLENFRSLNLDIDQKDLSALAQALADELVVAPGPGALVP